MAYERYSQVPVGMDREMQQLEFVLKQICNRLRESDIRESHRRRNTKGMVCFNSGVRPGNKSLEYCLKVVKNKRKFAILGSPFLGLNEDLQRTVCSVLGEEGTNNWDDWMRKHARKQKEEETTRFPRYPLAFVPEHGTQLISTILKR